jgi:hypothetical protein
MAFTFLAPLPLPETTTVLPNPNFSNSEATTAEVNILRTVNGSRRTYVKTKQRRRLQWNFTTTRNKALELFEFYRSYHAHEIFVRDQDERTFRGFIVNNPFEIEISRRGAPAIQNWPVGETCEIQVEFEGFETEVDITEPVIFVEPANTVLTDLNQQVFLDLPLPTFGALKHNWDATQISGVSDGNLLTVWPDSQGTNNFVNVVGAPNDPTINRSPTYRAKSRIINHRPTVACEQIFSSLTTTTAALVSTQNTTLFDGKRGTIFWVFAHTINNNYSEYLESLNLQFANNFTAAEREELFQLAFAGDAWGISTNTDYFVWSLRNAIGDTSRAEQILLSGPSSPFMPWSIQFEPPGPTDGRLIRLSTNVVPSLEPNIYCLVRNTDTTLRFRTNGVEREGTTIKNTPGSSGLFRLNDSVFNPEFSDNARGEWAQILVYGKALLTSEIEQVERFLSARWGISLNTISF